MKQTGAWIFLGIVIFAIIGLAHRPDDKSSQPGAAPEAQSQPTEAPKASPSLQTMKDTAEVVCRIAVKHRLKAPTSADFQDYNYDFVKEVREGTFYVETKADAVNSFGAKLRTTFGCAVQCIDENDCTVKELQEF